MQQRRLRQLAREAARRGCRELYAAAVEELRRGDIELSRLLVEQALELCRAARMRKPRFLRLGVCKNCGLPLVPGLSARVRLHSERRIVRVSITCLNCGYVRRMHLRRPRI